MILAVDVGYDDSQKRARVAGVVFTTWTAETSLRDYVVAVEGVAPYEPGAFFKRELPCILTLLTGITEPLEVVVVDGYVDLAPGHPGLGRHLYEALGQRLAVVGVAKSRYRDAVATPVLRGGSTSPLYVTAAGMDIERAATAVRLMHGPHRHPTLLKHADMLSRGLP